MLQTKTAITLTAIDQVAENLFIKSTQMLMDQDHNIESTQTTGSMLKSISKKEVIDLLLSF